MKYFIALVFSLTSTNLLVAQENTKAMIVENYTVEYISFKIVEEPPIYPGCHKIDNIQPKECFSNAISRFIIRNFNLQKSFTENYGKESIRMFSSFIISKEGHIKDIKVRALNESIEKELIRVIKQLPVMLPGKQKGKEVAVLYSFPIVFDFK